MAGPFPRCRRSPLGRRDYAIVLGLARLGLRAGEIAHLELEDVDWQQGAFSVRLSEALQLQRQDLDPEQSLLILRHTKGGQSRQVILHSSALSALQCFSIGLAPPERSRPGGTVEPAGGLSRIYSLFAPRISLISRIKRRGVVFSCSARRALPSGRLRPGRSVPPFPPIRVIRAIRGCLF